jgi:hypothetical protein
MHFYATVGIVADITAVQPQVYLTVYQNVQQARVILIPPVVERCVSTQVWYQVAPLQSQFQRYVSPFVIDQPGVFNLSSYAAEVRDSQME